MTQNSLSFIIHCTFNETVNLCPSLLQRWKTTPYSVMPVALKLDHL